MSGPIGSRLFLPFMIQTSSSLLLVGTDSERVVALWHPVLLSFLRPHLSGRSRRGGGGHASTRQRKAQHTHTHTRALSLPLPSLPYMRNCIVASPKARQFFTCLCGHVRRRLKVILLRKILRMLLYHENRAAAFGGELGGRIFSGRLLQWAGWMQYSSCEWRGMPRVRSSPVLCQRTAPGNTAFSNTERCPVGQQTYEVIKRCSVLANRDGRSKGTCSFPKKGKYIH